MWPLIRMAKTPIAPGPCIWRRRVDNKTIRRFFICGIRTNHMIELQAIHQRFQRAGGFVDAVQDVSLSIRTGEIFGIIGRSGAEFVAVL